MASLDRYIRGSKNYSNAASNMLPAFWSETVDSPPFLLQASKDQILTDFLKGFKAAQGLNMDPRIKNMNKNQLKALLSEWNSVKKDTIGDMLGQEMAEEIQGKILTGAGLDKDIEAIRLDGGADVQSPASQGAEEIQKALDKIKNALGGYIEILKNGQDNFLLMKIISLYYEAGGILTDSDLSYFNGLTISNSDTAINIGKVNAALNSLQDKIAQLQGNSVAHPFSSLDSLMKGAKKNLNQIGSEGIHESLGAYAANVVGEKINSGLMPNLKPSNLFKGSNWTIISESNATTNLGIIGKMDGQQQKDDIIIKWANGTYSISFPVTMKARYSSANYNPKTSNKVFGTITPQNIALGELLDMAYRSKTVFEKAWGTWLSSPAGYHTFYIGEDKDILYPNLIQSWNDFKKTAKYLALFRGLVGTGVNKDFSALMIVNSTIFSVYDILEQADTENIIRWSGYTGPPPEFVDIAEDVTGNYSKGNWPESLNSNVSEHQAIISKWYSKKYAIEIQLSNLSAVLR